MDSRATDQTTEEIWRTLSDRLRQFIQSKVKSDADADDILQDVFVRVHQKLDDVRQPERLESWVFQIARNTVVDHFRKSGRNHQQIDLDPGRISDSAVTAGDINVNVAGWLPQMIERLPEDQRRAVTLYELDGVSQQEVASRESISLSGAKSRVQRGRQALETLLKECCQFEFDRRRNVLGCEPVNCELHECENTCE